MADGQDRWVAEEVQAPEFNQFTVEMCRAAGFTPTVYEGTVESIRAAREVVNALLRRDLKVIMKQVTRWAAIIAVPTAITGFYGQKRPLPRLRALPAQQE